MGETLRDQRLPSSFPSSRTAPRAAGTGGARGSGGQRLSRGAYASLGARLCLLSITLYSLSYMRLLYLLALGAFALHAQTTASVSGAVADPSGAAVPGAKVVVANAATGAERSAFTDGEGRYDVAAL